MKAILGKRTLKGSQRNTGGISGYNLQQQFKTNSSIAVEYLVSWEEYPGEDTWESPENLAPAKHLIDDFEERTNKAKQEIIQKRENDIRRERQYNREHRGSFEKGDTLLKIDGMRRSKKTGELMCFCQWQQKGVSDPNLLMGSFVPLKEIKRRRPEIFLQFVEHEAKMFGNNLHLYPIYWTE